MSGGGVVAWSYERYASLSVQKEDHTAIWLMPCGRMYHGLAHSGDIWAWHHEYPILNKSQLPTTFLHLAQSLRVYHVALNCDMILWFCIQFRALTELILVKFELHISNTWLRIRTNYPQHFYIYHQLYGCIMLHWIVIWLCGFAYSSRPWQS